MATVQSIATGRDTTADQDCIQTSVVQFRNGGDTDNIIYVCYAAPGAGDMVFKKSTDSGATFGAAVLIKTGTGFDWKQVSVWYDQWTPGDVTNDLIHLIGSNVTQDEIRYFSIDTASADAIGGDIVIHTFGAGGMLSVNAGSLTICKATNGELFAAAVGSTGPVGIQVERSLDSGATWVDITTGGTTDFDEEFDTVQLMPLNTDDDVLLVGVDESAQIFRYVEFDNVGDAWGASQTIVSTTPDIVGGLSGVFGLTLDKTSGDIYMCYLQGAANANAVDVEFTVFSNSTRTWSTPVPVVNSFPALTSIPDRNEKSGFSLCRDQTDGILMLMINVGGTGSGGPGTLPHMFLSSDNGATWGDPVIIPTIPLEDYRKISQSMVMLAQNEGWYAVIYAETANNIRGLVAPIPLEFYTSTSFDDDAVTPLTGAVITVEPNAVRPTAGFSIGGERLVHSKVLTPGSGIGKVALIPNFADEGGNPDYQAISYKQGGTDVDDEMDLSREAQED